MVMASKGEENKERPARKLTKRPKAERRISVQFPEQLQHGEDVEEDVTAPGSSRGPQYINLNQSVFSLIAAAGSKTDLHARFDDDSSGSNTETEDQGNNEARRFAGKETHNPNPNDNRSEILTKKPKSGRYGSQRSDSKLLRSIPKLNIRTKREKNYMSQSVILPPKKEGSATGIPRAATPRDAPIMSMMLEAQAQIDPHKADMESQDRLKESIDTIEKKASVGLEKRLMEIFSFDEPEEVISGRSEQS